METGRKEGPDRRATGRHRYFETAAIAESTARLELDSGYLSTDTSISTQTVLSVWNPSVPRQDGVAPLGRPRGLVGAIDLLEESGGERALSV